MWDEQRVYIRKILCMKNKEPIRVLQIVGIACNGGVEAVVLNYYRHMDKSKVQFDFVVHKNPAENFVTEVKKVADDYMR